MKTKFLFFTLLCALHVNAQKNVFLDRSFWNEETTVEQVKEAIDDGNNPTEFNAASFDATVQAILGNAPVEVIEFLISIEGNSVNKITHDARNYLMWAGLKGNYQLIKMLIEKGSDIHILDNKGNNLQTYTAMGGSLDPRIYDLYKEKGLKLDEPNRQGATIVHYLAQNINTISDFDYFIEQNIDLSALDKDNNTIFHYAATQGNIELLKEFIDAGFDPKAINKEGENALFFAARGKRGFQNKKYVFQFLSEIGLDLTTTNKTGDNLLHILAQNNKNKEVYAFLIKNNVDIQKVNGLGNTPLMIAARSNNEIALSVLYDQTKDKKTVNKEGYSLLTYFLRNKNTEWTEKLMKENPSVSIVDKEGNNLIAHLVATYSSETQGFFNSYFKLLILKNVPVQDFNIHTATAKENEYLISTLIEAGVSINAKNAEGLTPLQVAAMRGKQISILRFLVSMGADKNTETEFGETVYELAKENELLLGDLEFLK